MARTSVFASILAGALLAACGTSAHAAGINLSWDDCGTTGAFNRDFACNTNAGSETFVGSAVAPVGVSAFVGMEVLLYISSSDPMPTWWHFQNAGSCRQTSATMSVDFTATPPNCVDPWEGRGVGGFVYDFGFGSPSISRLRIIAAVPPKTYGPLDSTSEYYMFKFRMSHAKTVGAGACPGCGQEMLINLEQIKLVQPLDVGDFVLTNPLSRNYVTWQTRVVPTQNRTWGAIKSLYR